MIGLLNAYRIEEKAPPLQLEYGPMCVDFLSRTIPEQKISAFEIALGHYPPSIHDCEAWIITGSPKSAYDQDPWIQWLGEFIRQCHQSRRKMIGICFGHQMIAHNLGGKTEKAKGGWGVGRRTFQILHNKPWMKPELAEMSLLFSHQDQVVKLPGGAELLAEDPFCPYQMYSIDKHILCFQGHPEFTIKFAKARMDTRVALLGQETYLEAVESLALRTNADELGQWMRNFMTL